MLSHAEWKNVVVLAVSPLAAIPVCGWAQGDNLSPAAQCDYADLTQDHGDKSGSQTLCSCLIRTN